MKNQKLPVLTIHWKRPEKTRRLLQRLLDLGVNDIYVWRDGPTDESLESCEAVEEVVQELLGQNTSRQRFNQANLGLRASIMSAVDWFLSAHKEGLVLEDDDLPTAAAIDFATENLARYRQSAVVAQINCTTHIPRGVSKPRQAYFSQFFHTWGFAIWESSWAGFREFQRSHVAITPNQIENAMPGRGKHFYRHWSDRCNYELRGAVDTYASSWNVFNFLRGSLALTPPKALVENIGQGPDASNHKRVPLIAGWVPFAVGPHAELSFSPPVREAPNLEFDQYVSKTQWRTAHPILLVVLAGAELARRAGSWLLAGLKKRSSDQGSGRREVQLTVAQRFFGWRILTN